MKKPQWHTEGSAARWFQERYPEQSLPAPRWPGAPIPSSSMTSRESMGGNGVSSTSELDNDLCHLAWELARLCVGDDEREALFHLSHALLQFAEQGSTFVFLPKSEARAPFGPVDLCVSSAARVSVCHPADGNPSAPGGFFPLLLGRGMSRGAARLVWDVLFGDVPQGLRAFVAADGNVPILRMEGGLALHRYDRIERRLAQSVAEFVRLPPLPVAHNDVERAWQEVKRSATIPLTSEQQWALLQGVHLPFTVIAGGPGTGKTSIVVSLLRMLARLGVAPERIALAAPTGKAANRLYEVVLAQLAPLTDPVDEELRAKLAEPRTLHRLLGYSPRRDGFDRDESYPLEDDVILVDECSMIDVSLMMHLFRACAPRRPGVRARRLLLLGDCHQLPSVDAGMVFQHLSEEDEVVNLDGTSSSSGTSCIPAPLRRSWSASITFKPDEPALAFHDDKNRLRGRFVATLTHSHRMNPNDPEGRAIYACAMAVRRGDVGALQPDAEGLPSKSTPADLCFSGMEHLDMAAATPPYDGFLDAWWHRRWRRDIEVDVGEGAATWPAEALLRHVYVIREGTVIEDELPLWRVHRAFTESQRILCLMRGHEATGAARVNAFFEAKRRAETLAHPTDAWRRSQSHFFAGEPVLYTHNHYDLSLFNGDQGMVAWTRAELDVAPRLRALFPRANGVVAHDLMNLQPYLERAYALTVHKAQGSQMEWAALLLPEDVEHPLLVRQLVYTAISRASRSVVLVGPLTALHRAAQNPCRRDSAFMAKVQDQLDVDEIPS